MSSISNDGGVAREKRGFGSSTYDKDKQRRIASQGGKMAHAKGTAHEFDGDLARRAQKLSTAKRMENRRKAAEQRVGTA